MEHFFKMLCRKLGIIIPPSEKSDIPINNIVFRTYGKLFYIKKKHICLECESVLENKITDIVVRPGTAEAKDYSFLTVDVYMKGNTRVITPYFECPMCGQVYEIPQYIKLEKNERKKKIIGTFKKIFRKI